VVSKEINLAKIRTKVRNSDGIKSIISTINAAFTSNKDFVFLKNAIECLGSLADDALDREEITRLQGIKLLVSVCKSPDSKIQITALLNLARCIQDGILYLMYSG
jgi:hypothetical protein